MTESKTQHALRLISEKGMTPYAAAHQVGITPTTVYAAINRAARKAQKVPCPCCGSLVEPERIKTP